MKVIINKNRLFLFWKIGEIVSKRQKRYENVVARYSEYFSYRFGMSKMFSTRNVNYMKKFYEDFPIYLEQFDRLSFEHYMLLVDISDVKSRYFYFRVALFCQSNVSELRDMITLKLYECM